MARPPKLAKVVKLDAIYAPDGRVICPSCWSRPSVDLRRENEIAGKRGYVSITAEEPLVVGKVAHRVCSTNYPCSNTECRTEIVIWSLLGYVGKDGSAPFRKAHTLQKKNAAKYEGGSTGKDGIWRDIPAVKPVVPERISVAPVAPPPAPKRVAKKKATRKPKTRSTRTPRK